MILSPSTKRDKKALFAYVAGVRERRHKGQAEVKLMLIDVKKAHIKGKERRRGMGRAAE